MFERISTTSLGENRGLPRIYLSGKWLLKADFAPGQLLEAEFAQGRLTIKLDSDGSRRVSSKKAGTLPVIDINSSELRAAFGNASLLQVKCSSGELVITPARTQEKKLNRCHNGKEGSLFSGGGLLTEAAHQAGYAPAFAVEWDQDYAEVFSHNHPEAKMFNCSVSEVPLAELPEVELLTIGVPCEPFSKKRRFHADQDLPYEAHELGDMTFWALRIIDHLNPATVIVEEVAQYLKSGAGWVMVHSLERMGYHVETKVINSTEYGSLARRDRAVIVATSDHTPAWPAPQPQTRKLAEVLDEVPADSAEWFDRASKGWLFTHWDNQKARGCKFCPAEWGGSVQTLTPETTSVAAIGKRYFAGQGDGSVVAHPSKPQTYRWLRLDEVKRLHGLPDTYYLGASKTSAGEILGQGVIVSTFKQIIAANRS